MEIPGQISAEIYNLSEVGRLWSQTYLAAFDARKVQQVINESDKMLYLPIHHVDQVSRGIYIALLQDGDAIGEGCQRIA